MQCHATSSLASYECVNFAFRFSANAPIPSFWSFCGKDTSRRAHTIAMQKLSKVFAYCLL